MASEALLNARVFDGEQVFPCLNVTLRDGRIERMTSESVDPVAYASSLDLGGGLLAPGLIDLQVNGGGGVMFNQAPSVATIRAMGDAHRPFGTTGFLPTLISDSREQLARGVQAVRDAIAEGVPGVLGIHVEGPFLNTDFCGIHDAGFFRDIEEEEFDLLGSAENGRTVVTVAPETVGPESIRRLVSRGVIVAGGHSAATFEQVQAALQAGLCGFTHLFNAMTPLGSREPGMVGAALADERSWMGIIADGQHVHPASFSVAVAAKKRGQSVLVTDGMATVGWDQDAFEWNGQTVTVSDGCCRLPDGRLAGSNLNMIAAVRNAARFARIDRLEALCMASLYPARALGLDRELGRIEPGFRASMIELDEGFRVRRSWIDGAMEAYEEAFH